MRRFIFIVLILLAAVVSGLVVRAKMASPFKAPVEDHGLSCRLSLPTAPPDKDHQIVCGLVVTNVSKGPIAVCTLNGRIGSQYPGRMEEVISPDFSKVHPTPQSLRASR